MGWPRTDVSGAPSLGWLPSIAAVHCVAAQRPPATIETTRHPCPTRILVGDILRPLGSHTGSFRNVVQASSQSAYLLNWERRENAGSILLHARVNGGYLLIFWRVYIRRCVARQVEPKVSEDAAQSVCASMWFSHAPSTNHSNRSPPCSCEVSQTCRNSCD